MGKKIIGATVGTTLNPRKIVEKAATANAIINKSQGESILLTDSANAPMDSMVVYGKSWQNTVGGNQLLNHISNMYTLPDGATSSMDAMISSIVDVRDMTNVYISGDFSLLDSGVARIGLYNEYPQLGVTYGTRLTPTKNTSIDVSAYNYILIGLLKVNNNDEAIKNSFMLNKGSTDLPWEPYVGGIPSPNPNYPQEIHSNGDGGSIEYGLYGGNLFNPSIITLSQVKVEKGIITINTDTTDYYIAGSYASNISVLDLVKGTYALSSDNSNIRITMYYKKDGIITAFDSALESKITTFWENVSIHGIRIRSVDGTSLNGKSFGIMLNVGSIKFPFEPYKEPQPLILQTPNGLGGLKVANESEANYKDADGNLWACDYIDLKRGKRVQRIVEAVLDGSTVKGYHYGGVWHFSDAQLFGQSVLHGNASKGYVMNKRFIMQSNDYACNGSNKTKMYFATFEGTSSLSASLFETPDNAGFLKFFSEHPTRIYAIRKEPIETDLTEEEIAQYKALMMNYPNTTILNDANAYTEVGYVADTKCYIDNKFKELEIALANTNAQLL